MPKSKATQPRISRFLQRLWDAEDKHPVMAGNPRNFNWLLNVESKPVTARKTVSKVKKKTVSVSVR